MMFPCTGINNGSENIRTEETMTKTRSAMDAGEQREAPGPSRRRREIDGTSRGDKNHPKYISAPQLFQIAEITLAGIRFGWLIIAQKTSMRSLGEGLPVISRYMSNTARNTTQIVEGKTAQIIERR